MDYEYYETRVSRWWF